ncbi:hypothetical protein DUI87_15227 [Hirundo rustica rustica]|uniref:acetate--CoA ligase n=1 Tax=Hirundo rustica rustica TaxID=333673 RepID=A0A3M0K3X0_HIRRU|nr:hypothetical protein DUI87_15227 [Hirundo rustica rustica]
MGYALVQEPFVPPQPVAARKQEATDNSAEASGITLAGGLLGWSPLLSVLLCRKQPKAVGHKGQGWKRDPPVIRVETLLERREAHKFLKVEFPGAGPEHKCDLRDQDGTPTPWDTSWDWAGFEAEDRPEAVVVQLYEAHGSTVTAWLQTSLAIKEQLWLARSIETSPLCREFEMSNPAGSKAVITYNQGVRGGRTIELKATVDEAVKSCPSIKHVFVAQRTDNKVQMGDRDIPLEEEMAKADSVCTPESMDSEDMLFMLYTSGSTGKPKGIIHTQAGYLLYAAVTHKYVFDYQQGDVFGCVADIGWITGHSYVVYGPLCNGATSVLFESTPVYPDPGRYWEVVQRLKINQFYGAPTAIRLLLNYGEEWVKRYDRSSLKVLGSVGEPINKEAWQWFYQVVGEGRCALVDTWWQTETGGICIAPRPSEEKAEIVPAMAMRPFFGIVPVLMDENGEVIEGNDVSGALCIAQPWPGMARTIHGDHQRFIDAYFKAYPGYYFTGDGAYRSQKGYYQITGRMDDIINISGHRLGTAEIEDAMADHPEVPETAVVGYPHKIKGEGAFAFIVLKEQTACVDHIKEELKTIVASKIAKYAVPDHILVVKRLPKTRSGKIMRRLLRKVVTEQSGNMGDVTTLDDPSVVKEILDAYQKYKEKSSS